MFVPEQLAAIALLADLEIVGNVELRRYAAVVLKPCGDPATLVIGELRPLKQGGQIIRARELPDLGLEIVETLAVRIRLAVAPGDRGDRRQRDGIADDRS